MTLPYFTVVVPVYNRAHLIAPTIESVLSQSWPDFELIIVDDGSTDELLCVVERFRDSRIRYVRQPNRGANAARNHGIDIANGRYVALLDSDDHFLPEHLADAARAHQAQPDAVIYSQVIVDRGEDVAFLKPPRPLGKGEHMSEYLLCDRGFLQTSTLVLPTTLARAIRYDESLPYGQDTDFAIRLYASGADFLMLERPSAVWTDTASPGRISAHHDPSVRQRWLEQIRASITPRAYLGCRGWHLAKALVRSGSASRALWYYLTAVCRGAYRPRLAATIGLQVFLPPALYRRIADRYIGARPSQRASEPAYRGATSQ